MHACCALSFQLMFHAKPAVENFQYCFVWHFEAGIDQMRQIFHA